MVEDYSRAVRKRGKKKEEEKSPGKKTLL